MQTHLVGVYCVAFLHSSIRVLQRTMPAFSFLNGRLHSFIRLFGFCNILSPCFPRRKSSCIPSFVYSGSATLLPKIREGLVGFKLHSFIRLFGFCNNVLFVSGLVPFQLHSFIRLFGFCNKNWIAVRCLFDCCIPSFVYSGSATLYYWKDACLRCSCIPSFVYSGSATIHYCTNTKAEYGCIPSFVYSGSATAPNSAFLRLLSIKSNEEKR